MRVNFPPLLIFMLTGVDPVKWLLRCWKSLLPSMTASFVSLPALICMACINFFACLAAVPACQQCHDLNLLLFFFFFVKNVQ